MRKSLKRNCIHEKLIYTPGFGVSAISSLVERGSGSRQETLMHTPVDQHENRLICSTWALRKNQVYHLFGYKTDGLGSPHYSGIVSCRGEIERMSDGDIDERQDIRLIICSFKSLLWQLTSSSSEPAVGLPIIPTNSWRINHK